MDLSIQAKLFYIYLFVNCNHAGIIKLNKRLCEFQTGIKSLATVIKELGNRLVRVKDKNDVFFLPKFIKFQYPNFPQSKVKQQDSALKILSELNIDYKSYLTLNEQLVNCHEHESVHDNDNVHNKGGMGGNIQKLWISTWGKNPTIPEQNETQKLLDKFGYEKVHDIMYQAKLDGFFKIKTLINRLDEKGNIKPKEEYGTDKRKTPRGSIDINKYAEERAASKSKDA